jgi:Protein of unknown function (DUF4013)
MNYTAAITDFFKPPKWMTNLLLAGVCVFIPFIGPIVIKGWIIGGLWGRDDERPEAFPDFDFGQFGKYLERGLWPFLVMLVSGVAIGMVLAIILIPAALVTTAVTHGTNENGCVAAIMALFMFCFYIVVIVAMLFLVTPLTLRATLTQDFAQSFNIPFVKRFASLMWKEILLTALFQVVASAVLGALGALALCIGIYFATVIIYFSWLHLHKQLYRLYLSRGGEPIPVSPMLRDGIAPATV